MSTIKKHIEEYNLMAEKQEKTTTNSCKACKRVYYCCLCNTKLCRHYAVTCEACGRVTCGNKTCLGELYYKRSGVTLEVCKFCYDMLIQ